MGLAPLSLCGCERRGKRPDPGIRPWTVWRWGFPRSCQGEAPPPHKHASAPPPPTRAPPTRSAPPRPPTLWKLARSPAPLPHTVSVQSPPALPARFSLHTPCKRPERITYACTTDAAAIHRHWLTVVSSPTVLDLERQALLQP